MSLKISDGFKFGLGMILAEVVITFIVWCFMAFYSYGAM
jgi:hypothetical protein